MSNVKIKNKLFWKNNALINFPSYKEMYEESINQPDKFWGKHGKIINWIKDYSIIKNASYSKDGLSIKWFEDGTLNACYNCIDRHLDLLGDETAIIWEGDNPNESLNISYKELIENYIKKFVNFQIHLNL